MSVKGKEEILDGGMWIMIINLVPKKLRHPQRQFRDIGYQQQHHDHTDKHGQEWFDHVLDLDIGHTATNE